MAGVQRVRIQSARLRTGCSSNRTYTGAEARAARARAADWNEQPQNGGDDDALEQELRELFDDADSPAASASGTAVAADDAAGGKTPAEQAHGASQVPSEELVRQALLTLESVWQRMYVQGRLSMPSEEEIVQLSEGTGLEAHAVSDFFENRVLDAMSVSPSRRKDSSSDTSLAIGHRLEKQAEEAGLDAEKLKEDVAAFPLEKFEGDWDNPMHVGAWNAAIEGEKEIAQQMLRLFGGGNFQTDELDEGDFDDATTEWLKDTSGDLISAQEIRTAILSEGEDPDGYGFFDEFDRGSRFKSPQCLPSDHVEETHEYKQIYTQWLQEKGNEKEMEEGEPGMSVHEDPTSGHETDSAQEVVEASRESAYGNTEHASRSDHASTDSYDRDKDAADAPFEESDEDDREDTSHMRPQRPFNAPESGYTNFDMSEEDKHERDVQTLVDDKPLSKVKLDMSLWLTEGGWDVLPGVQPSDPPGDGDILRKQNIDPNAETHDWEYKDVKDVPDLEWEDCTDPSSDATFYGTENGRRIRMADLKKGDELRGHVHTINLYNGLLIDCGLEYDASVYICEADWPKVSDYIWLDQEVTVRVESCLRPTYRFRFPIECTLLEPDVSHLLSKKMHEHPPIIKYEGEPHKKAWTEGGRPWPPPVEYLNEDPAVVEQREAEQAAMREHEEVNEQRRAEKEVERQEEDEAESPSAADGVEELEEEQESAALHTDDEEEVAMAAAAAAAAEETSAAAEEEAEQDEEVFESEEIGTGESEVDDDDQTDEDPFEYSTRLKGLSETDDAGADEHSELRMSDEQGSISLDEEDEGAKGMDG